MQMAHLPDLAAVSHEIRRRELPQDVQPCTADGDHIVKDALVVQVPGIRERCNEKGCKYRQDRANPGAKEKRARVHASLHVVLLVLKGVDSVEVDRPAAAQVREVRDVYLARRS